MRHQPTYGRVRFLLALLLAGCGGASADLSSFQHDAGSGHVDEPMGRADGGDDEPGAAADDVASADADAATVDGTDDGSRQTSDAAGSEGRADAGDAWLGDDAPSTGPTAPDGSGEDGGDGTGSEAGSPETGYADASGDAACAALSLTLNLLPSSCATCLQTTCGASLSFCLTSNCDDCFVGVNVCETASCAAACPRDGGLGSEEPAADAALDGAADAGDSCAAVAPCCTVFGLFNAAAGTQCTAAVGAGDVAACASLLGQARSVGLCM